MVFISGLFIIAGFMFLASPLTVYPVLVIMLWRPLSGVLFFYGVIYWLLGILSDVIFALYDSLFYRVLYLIALLIPVPLGII